jgi:ribonucleoside-triphosphate reductase
VAYEELPFSSIRRADKNEKIEELDINTESAVDQLAWYSKLQDTWSEQNVSQKIHYDPSEVPAIIEWLYENWDSYVGVSFAFRRDALKTAEEMGLPYLEQEVVSEDTYKKYIANLCI